MKNKHIALFALAFSVLPALPLGADDAQGDPVMTSITVTAPARQAEGSEVQDLLRSIPGVHLLSQGGSQSDLSIRGSTFSAAGLSLGGLTLRNPQTEHFHAELPLPALLLARPSVQTGLDNQGGHLTGTVGFDLLPVTHLRRIEAGVGSDRRHAQNLLLQHKLDEQVGIGLFAGRESARGVDYPDNDLDREYGGAHLQFSDFDTQADLVIAHQQKSFGARGYYGVPDTLAAHEKTKDTLVLLTARRGDLEYDYLRAGAAWREFRDTYQLPQIAYRNDHRSRTSSVFFDGRTLEVNRWSLGWRADAEEERIASRGSGGLGDHRRTRGGLSLLPRWRGDRLTLTVGARGEAFSGESAYALPQLGAEYLLSDHWAAFASYTEAVRLPSYTELYYNSIGSLGNTALRPQTEQQTELGLKAIPSETTDWTLTLFHRRTRRTIDWLRSTPGGPWTATDIGTLNTVGCEAVAGWYPSPSFDLQVAYTWLHKNRTAEDFGQTASRYALDYPEHSAQAWVRWRPVTSLELGAMQSVHRQTRNSARRSGRVGTGSSLVVHFTPPAVPSAQISLLLSNIWDDDFEELPGLRPPKRYAGLSLALTW